MSRVGRFGMQQCAANFSRDNGGKDCKTCKVLDDECHRINFCLQWKETDLSDSIENIDFTAMNFSDLSIWDFGNKRNSMRTGTA